VEEYKAVTDTRLDLFTVNFDHVYEHYIYPEYDIVLIDDHDLGYDENGVKILGSFDPQANRAYVDASLQPEYKDPRRVFTCWHEVGGHGVLQGDWLRQELARLRHATRVVTTAESISPNTAIALERQANLFAAHAAAPTWLVKLAMKETFALTRPIRYVHPARYSLNVGGTTVFAEIDDFDHLCRQVAHHIKWRFGGLSLEALGYRIAELRFVVDASVSHFRLHRVSRDSGSQMPVPSTSGASTAVPCV